MSTAYGYLHYRKFQTNPTRFWFSPELNRHMDLHEDILARIKAQTTDPDRPYMGELDYPGLDKIRWMINILPMRNMDDHAVRLGMLISFFDELWLPEDDELTATSN